MNRPKPAGNQGELMAVWALERAGWVITDRQVKVSGGHKADLTATCAARGDEEWVVEVKVWGADPSGKDTVKKAVADAYDLHEAGETRLYLLVLSHRLPGLLGDMITRARRAGVIHEVLIIGASKSQPTEKGDTP